MVPLKPVHIARNAIPEGDFRTVVENVACAAGISMQGDHVARSRGRVLNRKIIAPTGAYDGFRDFTDGDHSPVGDIYTTTDKAIAHPGERETACDVGHIGEITPMRSITENHRRKSVQNSDEEAWDDLGKLTALMRAGSVSIEWSYHNARHVICFEVGLRVEFASELG